MRIAQVAPLAESVPPKLYGGTERIVSYLSEELVELGHQVVLFASGDSETAAELRPSTKRALRLDPGAHDWVASQILQLEAVVREARRFDVIHFHIDYLHLPLFSRLAVPFVTTLHGRLDLPWLTPVLTAFPGAPFVSISDNQRLPQPQLNWVRTVHHGLPTDFLRFGEGRGGYLAFLGRIAPEKRPDTAIRAATAARLPLRIAAKIDPVDADYHRAVVAPLLRAEGVEFIGEIAEHEKSRFLGDAAALLFPIDWPEPFGLVMIEAMACGTPVIARRRGSVPEVIEDGVTGIVVDSDDELVAAIPRALALDRRRIRQRFEVRFGARAMALAYLDIYGDLVEADPMPVLATS